MAGQPLLDPEEWDLVIDKMVRLHDNLQTEIVQLVAEIKKEMNKEGSSLVPSAETKSTFGKQVKADIRKMWYVEYEIADLQEEFAKEMGSFDTTNMTVDFVEDVLIKSKPLQTVLMGIRKKQKDTMEEIKKTYAEDIKDLEPLYIPRPPKPDHDTLMKMKEGMSQKQAAAKEEAAPAAEESAPPAAPAEALPAEPGPAIEGGGEQQPAEVAA